MNDSKISYHYKGFPRVIIIIGFSRTFAGCKAQVSNPRPHLHQCILTYLVTYLLTYSIVQSPSWEANWFAICQEIPRISRNAKVHYRTHKRPPAVSILGQPNPVNITTSHLLEIHPNIIHPSTPRSSQWTLSLRFPHQEPIHPLSLPIRATCPAHLIIRKTCHFITQNYYN